MNGRKFTILHISDLHKQNEDDYENVLQSLKDDCFKYCDDFSLSKPEVIVVTGDIIKGGTPNEINIQYTQVSDFLNKLTEFFLNNDKSRIIIVPGNHDIDWNRSRAAMIPYKINNEINVLKLLAEDSKLRWSWKDLSLYIIRDENLYNARFDGFINFFNNFYNKIIEYSINPKEQYTIFDIPDLEVAFAAYNSCYNNDHLNLIGCINPVCITKSSDKLAELHKKGRLLIGAWHHHVSGLPSENNYLDYRVLRSMIDKNIQIGLFGHQHECHIINEYKNVVDDKRILLLSSGTLYGDKISLPSGSQRQYNVIEILPTDTEIHCTIHIREDKSLQLYAIPSWSNGRIEGTSISYWSTTLYRTKTDPEIVLNSIIVDAERSNDKEKAIQSLIKLDTNNDFVRKILLEYLEETNNYRLIYQYFIEPRNNAEAIILMDAALNINNYEIIENVLSISYIRNNTDPAILEQIDRLRSRVERKRI
ncbi:MAG: metallophosphoesterase [Bacteroidales bacterium]|jgi:predicted phosphodiesterase|nr:metallophosphoesterase [Bacteroidales bacterium]